ncbi:MAG TPA: hypothetical protein VMI31_12865 [Fimbriimonadaceae bacterium]|nr:hypothetical protein [Fimbriimonadaceae bacterium]
MSYEIPSSIEGDVRRYAQQEHISTDEAVRRLIQTGLNVARSAGSVFADGLGLFGSPEDASLLDEVVAIAYEERHRHTEPSAEI